MVPLYVTQKSAVCCHNDQRERGLSTHAFSLFNLPANWKWKSFLSGEQEEKKSSDDWNDLLTVWSISSWSVNLSAYFRAFQESTYQYVCVCCSFDLGFAYFNTTSVSEILISYEIILIFSFFLIIICFCLLRYSEKEVLETGKLRSPQVIG